jgi:hypothetical protein
VVEVEESSAGQVVACPHCGGQMQVPAAPSAPAASASAPPPGGGEATKRCPYCGETVLKIARKCKHCKEDLADGADVESIRARLRAKAQGLAGGVPEIPYTVGGKFRIVTIVTGALAALSLIGAFVGGNFHHLEALLGFGITGMFVFGICFLVAFANDCSVPSSRGRRTPVKGLKAFLGAIRVGRYKYAYACLLEGDKDDAERVRRAISEVSVDGGSYSFKNLAGFKEYWRTMTHASGMSMRRAKLSGLREVSVSGDYAVVSASVTIESYPWLLLVFLPLALIPVALVISLITKRETVNVSKLLRRVGNQWYVVNGELDSPEDRALEQAAKLGAGPGGT